MAKFVITIEDAEHEGLSIVSEPSLHELIHCIARLRDKSQLSNAEVFAAVTWMEMAARAQSKAAETGGRCDMGNMH